jgi:hypothetical protein
LQPILLFVDIVKCEMLIYKIFIDSEPTNRSLKLNKKSEDGD